MLLCLAAGAAFSPALWAPFHLDDFALFPHPDWDIGQTRPLTWFSFWLSGRISGESPFWWRLGNLLLHLASIAVLKSALGRFLAPRAAFIAAAIFALHPIQTEAVSYVFARATLLMTLFCLLCLRSWAMASPWTAVAWFVPALLAKEECVAFPLALIALSEYRHRPAIAAMLGLAAAAGFRVLYVASITTGSGAGAQAGVTALDYLQTQGVSILRYLRLLILPYGFTIESPVDLTTGAPAALAWAALALIGVLAARTDAARWFAASLMLLLPSSSIFPAADLAADRRMYLPLAALAAGAAVSVSAFNRRAVMALLVLLAGISFRQALLWSSPESLWREAVRLSPERVRPRIQLARQLPPSQALAVLQEAGKIAPDNPAVASETGRVLLEAGRPELALAEFGRALALSPGDPNAINNRGVALWKLGQIEAARADFERALQIDPRLPDARRNLDQIRERQ